MCLSCSQRTRHRQVRDPQMGFKSSQCEKELRIADIYLQLKLERKHTLIRKSILLDISLNRKGSVLPYREHIREDADL